MNFIIKIFLYIKNFISKFTFKNDLLKVSNNDALTRLSNIVMENNTPFKTVYPPIIGSQVNAEIHKIDTITATKMASAILDNAHLVNNDSNYLAACIMQESKFDPACFNHNLAEYNGIQSFEGTDWGCCQMSGYYLPSKPGMAGLTNNEMSAKAMSIEWAVPEMARVMQANLKQANEDLYKTPSLIDILKKLNTTQLSNEQFLATLYYNRGASGGLKLVLEKSISNIQHPFAVGKWYAKFKAIST